jgi:hypothetical protein
VKSWLRFRRPTGERLNEPLTKGIRPQSVAPGYAANRKEWPVQQAVSRLPGRRAGLQIQVRFRVVGSGADDFINPPELGRAFCLPIIIFGFRRFDSHV